MAKKKSPAKKPKPPDPRVAIVVLKGPEAYRAWLGKMSKDSLIPVSSIVRDALAKWAKTRGYPAPPEGEA